MDGSTLRYRRMNDGTLRSIDHDEKPKPAPASGSPAMHDPTCYPGGETRYLNQVRPDAPIEDLRDDRARKEWHRYGVFKDSEGVHREGPLGFQSTAERDEYFRRFGFRHKDRGQEVSSWDQIARDKWERMRPGLKRKLLDRLKRMSHAEKAALVNSIRG